MNDQSDDILNPIFIYRELWNDLLVPWVMSYPAVGDKGGMSDNQKPSFTASYTYASGEKP